LISITDGQPRLIEFGVSDEDVLSIGLACGGQIQILIEPSTQVTSHWVTHALETTRQRLSSTFVRVMNVVSSKDPIESAYWLDSGDVDYGSATRLDQQRSLFIQSFRPERRVIIVGGVHIAQALVQGLAAIDLTAVIVDPREVWANSERFPDVEIRNQWPDDALSELGVDPDTAVIALTHDPKFDDPALAIALKSEAFYIGALGGSKSAKSRRERLLRHGLTDSEIDRLHSPIGLPIGAKGPSEIMVSILAEVIASYRNVACG
jgi:xanthine dehydrogenase accessory factor